MTRLITCICLVSLTCLSAVTVRAQEVRWNRILDQPDHWYVSEQALEIARRVVATQQDCGGWNKNFDYARPHTDEALAEYRRAHHDTATIDNAATTTEIAFLARVHRHSPTPQVRDAILRGLDYLLAAQYPNGGWPQYYPAGGGPYSVHITYNDDAMIRVLELLRRVAERENPYDFVDEARRQTASDAVEEGVRCVLATQVEVDGQLTVWCAQHDRDTLRPVGARTYEHPSLSGQESVRIVQFLMRIENPDTRVIRAVQSAVRWFDRVKLTGIEVKDLRDDNGHRIDRVVIESPGTGPVWARFYEIGTNRPIFSGRDGVVKYAMSQIERERRVGYAWYSRRAQRLLEEDYPRWQTLWAPDERMLSP